MTVEELFTAEKITLTMLSDKSDESNYWNSCYNFISENWNRQIESLSPKQANWADKICEDMVELRIEGKL